MDNITPENIKRAKQLIRSAKFEISPIEALQESQMEINDSLEEISSQVNDTNEVIKKTQDQIDSIKEIIEPIKDLVEVAKKTEIDGPLLKLVKGDDGKSLKWEDLTDDQKKELRGEKGDDADEEYIIERVVALIPPPENGKTPRKGVDYFDGKNGSPDTPAQVIEKINKASGKIKKERIDFDFETLKEELDKLKNKKLTTKDLADFDSATRRLRKGLYDQVHGGGIHRIIGGAGVTVTPDPNDSSTVTIDADTATVTSIANIGAGEGVFAQISSQQAQFKTLIAGSNITITSDADEITINSTASGGADTWITDNLTAQVDGVLSTFSLTQSPKVGSPFMVFLSGVAQLPTYWSVTGSDISFTFTPPSGTELLVYYIQA